MCRLSRNLETSWNPKGLSWPVKGLLYLYRELGSPWHFSGICSKVTINVTTLLSFGFKFVISDSLIVKLSSKCEIKIIYNFFKNFPFSILIRQFVYLADRYQSNDHLTMTNYQTANITPPNVSVQALRNVIFPSVVRRLYCRYLVATALFVQTGYITWKGI
jgi:hypothetical protein